MPVSSVKEIFYLTYNSSGIVVGSGKSVGGPLPKNAIRCTREQAQTWRSLQVVNGVLVSLDLPLPVQAAQKLAELTRQGCQIASGSVPALNGSYALDRSSIADIMAEVMYVQTYKKFSGGQPAFVWTDVNGNPRAFPSTAIFMSFAQAMADYVTLCRVAAQAMAAGQRYAWPQQPMPIL